MLAIRTCSLRILALLRRSFKRTISTNPGFGIATKPVLRRTKMSMETKAVVLTCVRTYVTRGSATDAKIGNFLNANRVTMLPVINAEGYATPPLFGLKVVCVPYRAVLRNGIAVLQTFADYLPTHSVFALR